MPSVSELDRLRNAITARAESVNDLAGITVLSRKTGDLSNQIERELGRLGIVVIVMIPQAVPKVRQSERPVLDPVKVRFRVVEDLLLNKTGKSAAYIAERCLANFLMWKPAAADVPGGERLIPDDPGLLELNLLGRPDEEEKDWAAWDVFFTTKLALEPASIVDGGDGSGEPTDPLDGGEDA